MRRAASVALLVLSACDSPHVTVSRKVEVIRAPPDAAGPALPLGSVKLSLRADAVDVAWNGPTLHLSSHDCGAITAALETSRATSVAISADRDLPYAQVIDLMDCIKPHVANISIETP